MSHNNAIGPGVDGFHRRADAKNGARNSRRLTSRNPVLPFEDSVHYDAFGRLIERKVLTNLYSQENRLSAGAQNSASNSNPSHNDPFRKTNPSASPRNPDANELCPCGSSLKFKRRCLNKPTQQE